MQKYSISSNFASLDYLQAMSIMGKHGFHYAELAFEHSQEFLQLGDPEKIGAEKAKYAQAHSARVVAKNKNKSADTGWSVSVMEKDEAEEADTDDDTEATGDSMPMSQSNLPAGEETEVVWNREGDIVDERIRNDIYG